MTETLTINIYVTSMHCQCPLFGFLADMQVEFKVGAM